MKPGAFSMSVTIRNPFIALIKASPYHTFPLSFIDNKDTANRAAIPKKKKPCLGSEEIIVITTPSFKCCAVRVSRSKSFNFTTASAPSAKPADTPDSIEQRDAK